MKIRTLITTMAAAASVGLTALVFAQAAADNTNSMTFQGWMSDYSTKHDGRISRDAYLQESARRWDALDNEKRGLSLEEVNRAYGYPGPPTMNKDTAPPANQSGPGTVKK